MSPRKEQFITTISDSIARLHLLSYGIKKNGEFGFNPLINSVVRILSEAINMMGR